METGHQFADKSITFPLSFSTTCFIINATAYGSSGHPTNYGSQPQINNKTTTGFTMAGESQGENVMYSAWGK